MTDTFSEKTLSYLIELRARNDREWYQEHKPDYERYVLRPFQALVRALAPAIARIDPMIETQPATGKTISRVYRDSRFSKDKSLYRDRVWITFEQKNAGYPDVPAFYFELTPSGYSYGAGFYYVSPKTMGEYRAMIDRDEAGFLDTIKPVMDAGVFTVEGDEYKRGRYTGANPEIARWYNRKNIYVTAGDGDVTGAFEFDALTALLISGFSALAGIYHFWREAASR